MKVLIDNYQFDNKHITNISSTKYLGLMTDETLWKNHNYQLMCKLSSACYAGSDHVTRN